MKAITFDNYLFMFQNGISYDGLIDVNGIMLRSVSDTIPVPPEHHYVANPPRFAAPGQDSIQFITKNTLYYLSQDNKINTSEILSKISEQIVKYNPDGKTLTVDFGNNDKRTFPAQTSEVGIKVSDSEYFLAEIMPTFTVSVTDKITGNYCETKMPLDDLSQAYSQYDWTWLKTTNRVISAIGLASSTLQEVSGISRYTFYSHVDELSFKLYRPTSTGRVFHGNQYVKTYSAAKTLKAAGTGLFVVGALFDIILLANGKQSFGKTALNVSVAAIATFCGPVGLVIGITYFGLDALGVFDEPKFVGDPYYRKTFNPNEMPYLSCPADKTRVDIPMVIPELMPNLDSLNTSPMDSTKFNRLFLDQ